MTPEWEQATVPDEPEELRGVAKALEARCARCGDSALVHMGASGRCTLGDDDIGPHCRCTKFLTPEEAARKFLALERGLVDLAAGKHWTRYGMRRKARSLLEDLDE